MNKSLEITQYVFLTAIAFFAQNAVALCSDGRHPNVLNEFNSSSNVIVGRVVNSRDESSPDDPEGIAQTVYSVRNIKAFKGAANNEIVITSENTSSRFAMDVGKDYLLFVKSYPGINIVDNCGNSGLLIERGDAIDILNKYNPASRKARE
jgi:hypothetical protein